MMREDQRIATTVTSQAAKVGEIPLMVYAYWGSGDIALNKAIPDRQRLFVSVSRGEQLMLSVKPLQKSMDLCHFFQSNSGTTSWKF